MSVHVCDTCRDQPGSDTAREKGCTCPLLDNGHGHNKYRMVVNVDCPVHWPIGQGATA